MDINVENVDFGFNSVEVIISDKDNCFSCKCRNTCPLIECLSNGIVSLDTPVDVVQCGHYVKE